jgi:hypothetical protein
LDEQKTCYPDISGEIQRSTCVGRRSRGWLSIFFIHGLLAQFEADCLLDLGLEFWGSNVTTLRWKKGNLQVYVICMDGSSLVVHVTGVGYGQEEACLCISTHHTAYIYVSDFRSSGTMTGVGIGECERSSLLTRPITSEFLPDQNCTEVIQLCQWRR